MPSADRRFWAGLCAVALLLGALLGVAGAGGKQKVGQVTSFVATYGGVRVRNVDLQPTSAKPILRAGDGIRTTGRGQISFSLKTRHGTASCSTLLHFQPDALTVAPPSTPSVLIHFVAGGTSCSASASKKLLSFKVGKDATATTLDPVVEFVVRKKRTIVKVRRGVVVLSGRRAPRRAVVVGRNRQAVVRAGRAPLPPTRIRLTASERVVFKRLESHLPPVRDTTPPVTTIAEKPADPTPLHTASFVFRANESGVEFSCALDSPDFLACTGPKAYAGLDAGRHTFSARATDLAGNVGAAVSFSWTIERPASSPIVFESNRDGNYEIYSIKPDGSAETRLTNASSEEVDPSWSPDGTKIAFESDRDNGKTSELYIMNADGSDPRRLTTDPAQDRDPKWSPDGKQIAFDSNRSGNYEIYVMSLDSGHVVRLTNDAGRDADPAWSPDGTKIAFESDRANHRTSDVYVMNADGSHVRRLTTDPTDDVNPTWSPDGRRIALESARDGNHEIYVMNADGSGQTRLTENTARDSDPAWSPDGSRIAFASDRSGSLQIYVMNADGTKPTRLTRSGGQNLVPAW